MTTEQDEAALRIRDELNDLRESSTHPHLPLEMSLEFARRLRAEWERERAEPVAIVTVGNSDHGPFIFRETLHGADTLSDGEHKLYTCSAPVAAQDGMVTDGSTQCPLCGNTWQHEHSPLEVVIYRNGVKYGRSLSAAPAAQDALDARRYRWLRKSSDANVEIKLGDMGVLHQMHSERLDTAIDAAMRKEDGHE